MIFHYFSVQLYDFEFFLMPHHREGRHVDLQHRDAHHAAEQDPLLRGKASVLGAVLQASAPEEAKQCVETSSHQAPAGEPYVELSQHEEPNLLTSTLRARTCACGKAVDAPEGDVPNPGRMTPSIFSGSSKHQENGSGRPRTW